MYTPFADQSTKIHSRHIEATLILNMVQALHFYFRIDSPYLLHIDITELKHEKFFKPRMETGSEHSACQDNRLFKIFKLIVSHREKMYLSLHKYDSTKIRLKEKQLTSVCLIFLVYIFISEFGCLVVSNLFSSF